MQSSQATFAEVQESYSFWPVRILQIVLTTTSNQAWEQFQLLTFFIFQSKMIIKYEGILL